MYHEMKQPWTLYKAIANIYGLIMTHVFLPLIVNTTNV
jgi:hypothetical protein